MITLHDLEEAIAECQGERNPNANTCIKLAAYYTIRQEMFGDTPRSEAAIKGYSTQGPPENNADTLTLYEYTVNYDSGSEFSEVVDGKDAFLAWQVVDELMNVLKATNTRLYNGVIRRIQEI